MIFRLTLVFVAFNCVGGSFVEKCGQPGVNPRPHNRIVNGVEANPHSFPWMVSIEGRDDPHYCGGSILSERWILTAAHCAKIVTNGDQVVLGAHDRHIQEASQQKIQVERVFKHKNYESPFYPTKSFDIALLKLASPARLSDYVMPPCIPDFGDFGDSSSFPAGTECYVTGWGTTPGEYHPGDETGQPWKLRQAVLPLVDDETCKRIYLMGADIEIQKSMQCAGGIDQTSCGGDSGGPLVCRKNKVWFQVGIVSFGPLRCDSEIPAVFTRVAAFNDWITDTINSNGGP